MKKAVQLLVLVFVAFVLCVATMSNGSITVVAEESAAATPYVTRSKVSLDIQTQPSREDFASSAHIVIEEGRKKMEEGLDFGGKTFRFCWQGSANSFAGDYYEMVIAYCENYNLKLSVDAVPMSDYPEHVGAAVASGKPYDIVSFYGPNYSSQIIRNAMAPLNDYITTADLWGENSINQGGLSYSLSDAFSWNGNIYCVGGAYLQSPYVVWYNKEMFAAAGYDGEQDPLVLYNKGQWTWDKLYEMLQNIQEPNKGLYGLNTISPYYNRPFICTYDTDLAKRTYGGEIVQNLNDSQLNKAYSMLQKFCWGNQKVVDPNNLYESGEEQFLNGTIAACTGTAAMSWSFYQKMDERQHPAFGARTEQKKNIGMVPAPVANQNGVHAIWDWMGYGAGNGASEDGIKAAIAFAKWDSRFNHKQAYHPDMPADIKAATTAVLDSDKLRGPTGGFKSYAGSLDGIGVSISEAIARSGGNVTVTLKGYERMAQAVIDTALKSTPYRHTHTYDNACDKTCNVCDATRTTSHSYQKVVTKATLSANGKIVNKCKECGYTTGTTTTIYRPYTFKLSATSYTYNGAVKTPTVTVKDSAGKTISSSNYTVTYASGRKNAGTYTVKVTMKGNYSGTKTLSFKINPINVSKCKISLSATSYTYDGKVKKPTVTVKNANGTKLTKGTHYNVIYVTGCKEVGTYKVRVKMKGNYAGSETFTFKINPINISKCELSLSNTSYTYDGKTKLPTLTVLNPWGTKLTDSSYAVTYASGRKNVGTYKVTVKMKGNYTGTKTLTFKIKPQNISKCKVSLATTSYAYNGKVKTPAVTVKNSSGTKLTKNTHYTVTYASGRKNVGTYKVTVKMKGNYTGSKTLTFKIIPKAASINTLTGKTKSVTVKLNRSLKQSTGYEVQYSTSKAFKNTKTVKITNYKTNTTTIKSLKAKTTYYVRVRTYKTVNGTKYYSKWSTAKSVKTK